MADRSEELRTDFTGDADGLVKEAKRAEQAYEGIEDATKQLGRTMDLTDDDVEAMGDALADSIRQNEKAQDSLRKMREELKKVGPAASDAGDDVGRSLHDISDDAGDAAREVGDEFKQNLGQSLSSGNMEDLVSETLGGLVSGLKGPVGLVAAGAAGLAALAFNSVRKSIEEWNTAIAEGVATRWEAIISDLGDRFGEVNTNMSAAMLAAQEWDRLWKEQPEVMQELVDASEQLGISARDVTLARAGDEEALKRVRGELDAYYEKTDGLVGVQADSLKAWDEINRAVGIGNEQMGQANELAEDYNATTEATDAAMKLITQKQEQWRAGMKLTNDELTTLSRGLQGLPEEIQANVRLTLSGEDMAKLYRYGGTVSGWSPSWGPKPSGMAAASAGPAPAPPVVTNNWNVTVEGARDPDATVRALQRWTQDNGRPESVKVAGR